MNRQEDIKTALVIVDVQNDYFEDGRNPLPNARGALDNAKRLRDHFRTIGRPVIHVMHISTKTGASFFLPETNGIQIHTQLAPEESEAVIIKHKPDSFADTQLNEHLCDRGIDSLVICGMMSHHCIDSTVRTAKNLGYRVFLAHDACAARSLKFEGETISDKVVHKVCMAALQGFATVVSTKEITCLG